MKTIAEKRKTGETAATQKHLRPCDVFDVIGGVGIGGYVAALLHSVRVLRLLICLFDQLASSSVGRISNEYSRMHE